MKMWIFNNYNMLPEHGQLNRAFYFGKYLTRAGHEPIVFVGSHPHNTNLQLITDGRKYKQSEECNFPWVLVKTCNYEGSILKRIYSMFQYYFNAKKASTQHEKPDAIIGSSAHPLAAVLAIRLSKKYRCKGIVEVRDLWPESLVAYGIAGPHNPAVLFLRRLEKWIYKKADALIFTMEGAYDYIIEQGWEKDIPRAKVHYINNGVDLEVFDYNKEHYQVDDLDLEDPDTFKVVYTGSIRRANNMGRLLDAAKEVVNPRVKFLVWGDGDELSMLKQRVIDENITNVVFKGKVEKKYVPYIVSCADLNFIHGDNSQLMRFGISMNKVFDYLASGKPVLMDFKARHNTVLEYSAGISCDTAEADVLAKAVIDFAEMESDKYEVLCKNAREAARVYDFANLTQKLIDVLNSVEA